MLHTGPGTRVATSGDPHTHWPGAPSPPPAETGTRMLRAVRWSSARLDASHEPSDTTGRWTRGPEPWKCMLLQGSATALAGRAGSGRWPWARLHGRGAHSSPVSPVRDLAGESVARSHLCHGGRLGPMPWDGPRLHVRGGQQAHGPGKPSPALNHSCPWQWPTGPRLPGPSVGERQQELSVTSQRTPSGAPVLAGDPRWVACQPHGYQALRRPESNPPGGNCPNIGRDLGLYLCCAY